MAEVDKEMVEFYRRCFEEWQSRLEERFITCAWCGGLFDSHVFWALKKGSIGPVEGMLCMRCRDEK